MQKFINIIVVLLIGFSVGGFTASLFIQQSHGIGAINAGPWSAWPFVGGVEVDPYTVARSTANGTIPLGAVEGLSFEATEDSQGNMLELNCVYTITGNTSVARAWTISAYNFATGEIILGEDRLKSALFSGHLMRYPDSSFLINASYSPHSGNWLPLKGNGRFRLVLRLFDTPITSNTGLADPTMPSIDRGECST